MKTRNFFLTALGLLFFCVSLSAQTLDVVDPTPAPGDSTVFNIELPVLVSKTKFKATPAFYKHLFIFGDGNFSFGESQEKGSFKHRYGAPSATAITSYFARAYSTGVYSGDDEPPLTSAGPITPPSSGVEIPTSVVDSNRYLKILRNVQVKPGDPFVSIVSVKNPSGQAFSGQVFFLYNGKMRTVSKTEVTPLSAFSEFNIRENLFHRPDAASSNTYQYTKLGPLAANYRGLLVADIFDLPPGEEIHYFVDMVGDTSMLSVFDATVKAEMDFAAALGTYSEDNNYPILVPDSLQQELGQLGLSDFVNSLANLSPDRLMRYDPNTNISQSLTTDLFPIEIGAPFLLDYYTSTASLVKSHDPNFMLMEACKCPEAGDRYQIFTTVQCENAGYGPTDHIYIDIKLPAGIEADDIISDPVSYFPSNGPGDQISLIKLSDDSIRWELLNFQIEGTPIHGVGDPRTFANVKFNMYTDIAPSELDSIYACIRFDDLSNAPICTVPVAVSLVGSDAEAAQVLSCAPGDCADAPPADSLPWWWWIVLLLILLILLIFWLIRRN